MFATTVQTDLVSVLEKKLNERTTPLRKTRVVIRATPIVDRNAVKVPDLCVFKLGAPSHP